MVSNDLETAQVLEDAADLYESEQIGWCTGTWVEKTDRGETETLSMCAEGALMKAAGFDQEYIYSYGKYVLLQTDAYLRNMDDDAFRRYEGARRIVGDTVGYDIPPWNDELVAGKQDVIDVFREIAKDLRNQAPAEEL